MLRLVPFVLAATLAAGEAGGGHVFRADELRIYLFRHRQTATWESAGDELSFATELFWRFTLVPEEVAEDRVLLTVTFTHLTASLTGPGSEHSFDSHDASTDGDPLFGHLRLLAGRSFGLTVNPATGGVSAVTGGEEVIAAMNRAQQERTGDTNPYLERLTRQMVAPERLRLLWTRILQVPGTGPAEIPLAPSVEARLRRTWDGPRWRLALPEDAETPLVEISGDPAPAHIRLTELGGEGSVTMTDGVLERCSGELTWTATGTALTQRFAQRHRASWECRRSELPSREP